MNPIITYLLFLLVYIVLYCITRYAEKNKSERIEDVLFNKGNPCILLRKQLMGIIILCLGVMLYIIQSANDHAIFYFNLTQTWKHLLPLIVVVTVIISILSSLTSAGNLTPANTLFSTVYYLQFFTGRIIFIVLYEFFFRGVLLFSIKNIAGAYCSMAINILLYVFIHHHFRKTEIIAVLFFGLLLCTITLVNNSVWAAVILHLTVTLLVEVKLVFFNKNLKDTLI